MITENIALLVERGHCARQPKKHEYSRWSVDSVVGIRSSDGVRYLEKDGMLARGWKMEREGTTGTTGQEYTVFIYELWKIQVSTAAVSSR